MLIVCGKHLVSWEDIILIRHHAEYQQTTSSKTHHDRYTMYLQGGVSLEIESEQLVGMLKQIEEIQNVRNRAKDY